MGGRAFVFGVGSALLACLGGVLLDGCSAGPGRAAGAGVGSSKGCHRSHYCSRSFNNPLVRPTPKELLASGLLVEVPSFSKFLHGGATAWGRICGLRMLAGGRAGCVCAPCEPLCFLTAKRGAWAPSPPRGLLVTRSYQQHVDVPTQSAFSTTYHHQPKPTDTPPPSHAGSAPLFLTACSRLPDWFLPDAPPPAPILARKQHSSQLEPAPLTAIYTCCSLQTQALHCCSPPPAPSCRAGFCQTAALAAA